MAVYILPKEPEKPKAEIRLNQMIEAIGFNPFNGKKLRKDATWRHCIIYKMSLESFSQMEIAKATQLNHATITLALQNIKGLLEYRDELAHRTWKELLEKVQDAYYL